MGADNRLKRVRTESPVNRIRDDLLSEFPELVRFSPDICKAVIGPYRESLRGLTRIRRSKEEISGYYQQAIALYKLLENPRPHHLSHLNGLDLSDLEDARIVRKRLIERIEWSKRIATTRPIVFGYLWKDIVAVIHYLERAQSLQLAYPNLIPKVSHY